jgi:hypothetical protein
MATTIPTAGRNSIWRMLRLHSWLGRAGWALGIALAVIVACWFMSRSTPTWYQPLDPSDSNVNANASRAETLMNFEWRNTMQRVPLGDQTWSITQDELNSYLAVYASRALDSAGNPISDPYVVFSKNEVTLAARSKHLPGSEAQGGVGSVTFGIGIVTDASGMRRGLIQLRSVHAGLLPVPKSVVETRMREFLPVVINAAVDAARTQLGISSRENAVHDLDEVIEQIIRHVARGEPFPLEFRAVKKDIVIKELLVEKGRLTIVLSPARPVTSAPNTLPPGGN